MQHDVSSKHGEVYVLLLLLLISPLLPIMRRPFIRGTETDTAGYIRTVQRCAGSKRKYRTRRSTINCDDATRRCVGLHEMRLLSGAATERACIVLLGLRPKDNSRGRHPPNTFAQLETLNIKSDAFGKAYSDDDFTFKPRPMLEACGHRRLQHELAARRSTAAPASSCEAKAFTALREQNN